MVGRARLDDMTAEYVDLPIYHEELARALGFTAADLVANRAGRLTPYERAFQVRLISRAMVVAAACLLIATACVVLAFAIGISTGLSERILIVAAFFGFVAGLMAWTSFPLWQDLKAGLVSSVEGFVQPTAKETRIRTGHGPGMGVLSFYWVVDNQRFAAPGKAYGVLTPARHRLYFLPLTRRVVAAEPITGS